MPPDRCRSTGRAFPGTRDPTERFPPWQPGRVTRVTPVHRGSSLLVVVVEGPPYIAARPAPRHSTSRVCSIEEVRNDAFVLPRTAARCSHGLGPDMDVFAGLSCVTEVASRACGTEVRAEASALARRRSVGSGDPLSPKASGPKTRNRRSDQLQPIRPKSYGRGLTVAAVRPQQAAAVAPGGVAGTVKCCAARRLDVSIRQS